MIIAPYDFLRGAMSSENEADDVDAFSDISSDSDVFNVKAVKVTAPRTDEDADLAIAYGIMKHLREYPLLPLDGRDQTHQTTFMEVDAGMRMPSLHCGFLGCSWTCNKKLQFHWDAELELYRHFEKRHRYSEGMQNIPLTAWANYDIQHRGPTLNKICRRIENYDFEPVAYYLRAVRLKEEQHIPIIGASIDRRMLVCDVI